MNSWKLEQRIFQLLPRLIHTEATFECSKKRYYTDTSNCVICTPVLKKRRIYELWLNTRKVPLQSPLSISHNCISAYIRTGTLLRLVLTIQLLLSSDLFKICGRSSYRRGLYWRFQMWIGSQSSNGLDFICQYIYREIHEATQHRRQPGICTPSVNITENEI